ncbi:MAG: uncharacterized protein JWO36_955 [Myxococcales bacterium]|nr:uncharacterized protein [Myxococcales bacterium]
MTFLPSRGLAPHTRTLTVALASAALATLATLASAGLAGLFVLRHDPCALPPGVESTDAVAMRAMACEDLEHHRISLADYRLLIGVDLPPAPPAPQWASTVRGFSSEYSSTRWAATQVLGAPDVYPAAGDDARAWASRDADATTEFIEVGFAQPQRMRELRIYETLNPGAIEDVEVITTSGRHLHLGRAAAGANAAGSAITTYGTACTNEPVVAARITLGSAKVAGWNEIDAIGALPCR